MLYRQEALPKTVCDIAWKAQLRLTSRFRKLVARGKAKPKVATQLRASSPDSSGRSLGRSPRRPRSHAAIRSVRPAASRPVENPRRRYGHQHDRYVRA